MENTLSLETVRVLRHTLSDLRDRDWQVGFTIIALFAPHSPRSHLVTRAREDQQQTLSYREAASIDVTGSISSALAFLLECYPDSTGWTCHGVEPYAGRIDPEGPYGFQCELPGLLGVGSGWTPALSVLDALLAITEWHLIEHRQSSSSDEDWDKRSLPRFRFEELIATPSEGQAVITNATTWRVDKGAYRTAYYEAIESAKTSLSQTLMSQVSTPEAWALTTEYVGARKRIMIMGQETFGNLTALSYAQRFQSWSASIGESIAFDFAIGESQETSPFWRAYEEIIAQLGLPSRRHTAWTNLAKVQLTREDGPSRSISTWTHNPAWTSSSGKNHCFWPSWSSQSQTPLSSDRFADMADQTYVRGRADFADGQPRRVVQHRRDPVAQHSHCPDIPSSRSR